ncbi:hypothetical protein [Nonomuraea sp. NPDC050643]|uniref:hypothetical protein n=1 Tax=Nonomuraea sp. NPDC050643 TaxID=3155660 RepID=UPI0033F75588
MAAHRRTRLPALWDDEIPIEPFAFANDLEQAYLHGRFGALPEVDRPELLRVLGLIG